MADKMTIWGVGWKFAWLSFVFAYSIAFLNNFFFPQLRFTVLNFPTALAIGVLLIGRGLIMLFSAGKLVRKAFREGRLETRGIYSVTRNPIYAAWIIYIIPGFVIISRYTLCLLIPFIMYLIFKSLIKSEDTYLEQKFGDEYRNYRKNVNELIPWKKKKPQEKA